MELTRRHFLLGLSALMPSLSLAGMSPTDSDTNLIIGGGSYRDQNGGSLRHVISIVALEALSLNLIPTGFLPHGFHRNPQRLQQIAVFEKKGPGALVFDILTKEISQIIQPLQNRHFYGHGAFTVDGKILLSTETDLKTRDGVIGMRDVGTMKYLGEFPSYGKEPHECKLIDDGKTLVVTNGGDSLGGELPNVAYIDIESKKLIERVPMTNDKINTGHIAINHDGALIVVSAPRKGMSSDQLGGVSIRPNGAPLISKSMPADIVRKMKGEALSVCIHDGLNIAAVTHPGGNMLTFWSTQDGSLLSSISLPAPRGIALTKNSDSFIVSYGPEASLARVSVADLKLDPKFVVPASYMSGSHIYNWSRQMLELHYPRIQLST